ncbi:30S ribosomal protein S8 [bacterium]|nr:MAG: 30S ribosomal protein S8 [bacterium]RIK64927.1 MAG: 30S ribosomal protein S8 [Planctomycetota bacterium]
MSFTDPIADMLTRLRNANANGADKVEIPFSNLKLALAEVLKREGFINAVKVDGEGYQRTIALDLRYGPDGERVITKIERVSKPGRRIYTPVTKIPRVRGGMGICILSTPKGVLSDRECRRHNVGGEMLCKVG